jgi:hypothetical protein
MAKTTKSKTSKSTKAPKTKGAKKSKASKTETLTHNPDVTYPDPPKNKRAAYTFFFQEQRPAVAAEIEEFGDITREVSKRWNALSDSDKEPYEKLAGKDAKRFKTERSAWETEVRKLGGIPDQVIRDRREAKKRKRNRVKKPKGARNPYVFFSIEKRKELADEDLDFNQMAGRISKEWKKVSEKGKRKYEKLAEKDRARYEKDMEKFREEHPDQEDAKKTKRKRKKEGEPKNPRNSYIFFSNEERSKVKADNPDMAPKDVMKELGKRWNDLSDKQKGKYDELATKDRKRYEKEMKTWRKSQEATA